MDVSLIKGLTFIIRGTSARLAHTCMAHIRPTKTPGTWEHCSQKIFEVADKNDTEGRTFCVAYLSRKDTLSFDVVVVVCCCENRLTFGSNFHMRRWISTRLTFGSNFHMLRWLSTKNGS